MTTTNAYEHIHYIEALIKAGFDPAHDGGPAATRGNSHIVRLPEGVPDWVAGQYDGVMRVGDSQMLTAGYGEDTLTLVRQTLNGVTYAMLRFDAPDQYFSELTAKAFTAVVEAWST